MSPKLIAVIFSVVVLTWGATQPVVAGATGYWRFEGTGGTAADEGGSFPGTLLGGAARSSTIFGTPVPRTGAANTQSMEFSANGDAVNTGTGIQVDSDDYTLEAFVNLRDALTFPLIAGKQVSGNFLDFGFELQGRPDQANGNGEAGPGKWKALFRSRAGSGDGGTDIFSADLDFDTWYHLAGVRSSGVSDDTLTLYVDGVSAGSATIADGLSYTSGQEFSIGGANTSGGPPGTFGRAVNGFVDEVRLSNSALATTEFLNVPEPAAIVLLLAGLGLLLTRRRK